MAPSNMLFELVGRANPTPSTDNRTGTDTRIFDLPQSVLAKIPALLPPPGETSNFVNPEDIGGVLVGISIFGLTILVICVSIRLWVIFRLLRPIKWAWSDVVFTVAILTSIALYICFILTATGNGQIGIHQWNAPLSKMFTSRNLHSIALAVFFIPLSFGLMKVTIFLTYIELFSRFRWIKISCYLGIIFTSIFYSIIVICTGIWSFPISNFLIKQNTNRLRHLSIPTSAFGLATDIYLFVIPLIAVGQLKKMTRRKRVGLALIFGTGFLAVIASCLSIVYRCIEERSLDSTWNILPVDAIAALELAIGIIIACTPHIAKFLRIYGNAFSRAYSIIAYYLCCKPRKMAGSTKGSKESKGTKETDTFNSSTPKRHTKLYPGLDLTTFRGTHLDNVDEENEIKKVSSESPTDQHPAAQYPEDVHWAERHRGMQESFVDGV